MDGWNTTWLGISDITPLEIPKPHEYVVSQSKFISIKEILQYIMMYEHEINKKNKRNHNFNTQ
jgi:hypothetical protein